MGTLCFNANHINAVVNNMILSAIKLIVTFSKYVINSFENKNILLSTFFIHLSTSEDPESFRLLDSGVRRKDTKQGSNTPKVKNPSSTRNLALYGFKMIRQNDKFLLLWKMKGGWAVCFLLTLFYMDQHPLTDALCSSGILQL